MKDRLSRIFKDKNLTAVKFAEMMGIQASSVSHLLSGRNKPSYDFIVKFMETFPDVNIGWFLSGKGAVYGEPHEMHTVKPPAEQARNLFSPHSGVAGTLPPPKEIDRIIVFYTDRTFSTYTPE